MRTVLLWILGILLGIVLLALVIVLVLLNIRAGIEAVGVTGEVSVEARYGPVRIPLYPRPRHLKKKKEETDQIMRCMTRKGTGLLTVSMLAGWFVMFFLLPVSGGSRGIGTVLDAAFFVFSVAACLQLAFCYKSAYLVTLLSGLGGTLLWGWKMFEKGTGVSLAVFYLIVLVNSVIAVRMQYFSGEKECAL